MKTVIVRVNQGALKGKEVTSASGVTYYSFQGIPFAKPPLGLLRFKAPEPADPWTGIRDALKEGAVCPQIDKMDNTLKREEDCLFLNVYTQKMPPYAHSRAVMVWIHGGAFSMGSGNLDMFAPDYLLQEDVVVVSMNYRLGALGFLNLENSDVSANNGLKDQVLALRWVQQNIVQFGGNPGNVTIFGVSAGARCVGFHTISPMSKGLFHHAIAQSGTVFGPNSVDMNARERGFSLGELFGCKTNDVKTLVDFLRSVPVKKLVTESENAKIKLEQKPNVVVFRPSVEKSDYAGKNMFLPSYPEDILIEGNFNNVPLIVGANSADSMFIYTFELGKKPDILETYNRNLELLIPIDVGVNMNSNESQEVASKIKKFYFGNEPICKETVTNYVKLLNDFNYFRGMHKMAKMMQHKSNVYCYQFSFEGKLNFTKSFIGSKDIPGACHGDETSYISYMPSVDIKLDPESAEMKTRSRMVKMWTNFAKTGDPTPELNTLLNVKWKPVSGDDIFYLDIDTELSLRKDLSKEGVDMWNEIYCTAKK